MPLDATAEKQTKEQFIAAYLEEQTEQDEMNVQRIEAMGGTFSITESEQAALDKEHLMDAEEEWEAKQSGESE